MLILAFPPGYCHLLRAPELLKSLRHSKVYQFISVSVENDIAKADFCTLFPTLTDLLLKVKQNIVYFTFPL